MSMINRTVTENELFSRLAKYTGAPRLGTRALGGKDLRQRTKHC
jgi:truncated hemoglobin YjbI